MGRFGDASPGRPSSIETPIGEGGRFRFVSAYDITS
jgi:hypothetical protein